MNQNNKKIVAIVEARMTSSRLPGKVLLPLAGQPALQMLIERLKRSRYLDGIVVATTTNPEDDPITELANNMKVGCYRGSEFDVLDRVLQAAKSVNADLIVEITGDCPFSDPALVDRGVEEFFFSDADYVANTIVPTFPNGFDVQVYSPTVLAKVATLTSDPTDRVHVTYYIYNHPEQFKLYNWQASAECYGPDLRVTLDEESDYRLLNILANKLLLQNKNFTAADVVALLKREPELKEINKYVRQKEAAEK